jgi:hypothetical protein
MFPMNTRRLVPILLIAALVAAGAAMIGIAVYNAGVAHGIAESGRIAAIPPTAAPYVYGWPRPWGFGFFPILPFFFFFLLLFFVTRAFLWRGAWGAGWGCRYEGVPPAFDEWHRRAHAGERQANTSGSEASA